jgi:hypothetical protein
MSRLELGFRLEKRVTLNIAVFYTNFYHGTDDRGTIKAAEEVLDRHNIALNVWPMGARAKATGMTIVLPDYPDGQVPHTQEAYQALRASVESLMRGSTMVLYAPVVFTRFEHAGYGIAPQWFKRLTNGCLLRAEGNKDKMDLLHELGHCAMTCTNDDHMLGDEHRDNVMSVADGRSSLYRFQVEGFGKAMFATG